MPYFWNGVDIEGQEYEGISNLTDSNTLKLQLKQQNIFKTKIHYVASSQLKTPISLQLLVDFLLQFQKMLASGISFLESLNFIIRYQRNSTFAYILCQITEDLKEGHSLQSAFERFEKYWPPLFLKLIVVAEHSDQFPSILKELLIFFETRLTISKQRQKMLFYPVVVAGFSSLIFLGILIFIVPMFEHLFVSFKNELPISTQVVMAISSSLRTAPLMWLFGVLIIGVIGKIWYQYLGLSLLLRWIPVFSKIEQSTQTLFYARSLALTIQAGLNFGTSLKLAESVISKDLLPEVQNIHHKINYGELLAKAYLDSKLFTPVFVHLVAMGESVGNLESAFEHIVELNQEWLERRMNLVTSFIEPLSILIVAFGVLFALISIYLPIFNTAKYF